MNIRALILTSSFLSLLLSQSNPILPGQKTAIRTLASSAGFSPQELEERIQQDYGLKLEALSQMQGAELIRSFQSGSVSKVPLAVMRDAGRKKTSQQDLVPILEKGMVKRFHFKDGSVREGEIITVSDGLVTLKTTSGSFTIPEDEFLAETAEIKNKNGETFTGVVMGETAEEFIIRTKYGDAIVQKKDVNKMKRYHGGVLDQQTENTRKFYKGSDELTNIFLDPTAFPLSANTFYVGGLSLGYGLTERFMMTTQFGSNFSGDLNLHAKMRFYHKKAANRETAAAWGLGMHRAYSPKAIVSKYSHAINLKNNGVETALNDMVDIKADSLVPKNTDDQLHALAYIVFSSRRANPSGRGKVGWTAGARTSTAFLNRNSIIKPEITIGDNTYQVAWNDGAQYKVPFRIWLGLEYDLRKNLKFLSTAWIDNGFKTVEFGKVIQDYIGDDDSAPFSIDYPGGKPSLIDFDFGIQYAVNESFRFGIHFQQPYIDFYWEFFEF